MKPRRFTSSAKSCSRSALRQLLLDDMQPAEPFILVRPRPQRCVAGPQPADAALLAPDLHFRLEAAVISGPPDANSRRSRSPSSSVRRPRATAPSKFVERVGELLHPVRRPAPRDLLQRDAGCSSSASTARAPAMSCSMASGVTSPWSRKASMVAGGIVLTVSRPISASTYIVSL